MKGLNTDELQVGLLIWWKRDSDWSSFNTPCVVTYLNREENTFRVFAFDEMKETKDLSITRGDNQCKCNSDPSSLTEMRLSNTDELVQFIKERAAIASTKIVEMENRIGGLKNSIEGMSELIDHINSNDLLKHITKPKTSIIS